MGIFSRNYSRPGKGIDPNAPEKNAFFMFFELVGRRFFKLVTLNMLYLIIILPILIFGYGQFYGWLYERMAVAPTGDFSITIIFELFGTLVNAIPEKIQAPLVMLSVILQGPFTMGFTYVIRNYSRQEHAWTSDFFVKTLENYKQGLVFSILDAVSVILLLVSFNLVALTGVTGGWATVLTIWKYVHAVLFGFYLMMRIYFYQIAVTMTLPVGGIIKNAAIMAILGLWRNALALILTAVSFLIMLFVHPIIEVITLPFIAFSFCGFLIQYITYPVLDKYIIQPAKLQQQEDEEELPPDVLRRMGELPPELGGPGAGSLGIDEIEE